MIKSSEEIKAEILKIVSKIKALEQDRDKVNDSVTAIGNSIAFAHGDLHRLKNELAETKAYEQHEACLETNHDGRYTYWRMVTPEGDDVLIRDDTYRVSFYVEHNLAREKAGLPNGKGQEEWVLLMEYKHCNIGWYADRIISKMLGALEPALIKTIDERLLE